MTVKKICLLLPAPLFLPILTVQRKNLLALGAGTKILIGGRIGSETKQKVPGTQLGILHCDLGFIDSVNTGIVSS